MTCLNTKSNKSYAFDAPYEEVGGDKVTHVLFPVAVTREPDENGVLQHDAATVKVEFDEGAASGTVTVETDKRIQPGNMIIAKVNDTGNKQTVAGVECAAGATTLLVWTGDKYLALSGGSPVPAPTLPGAATQQADGLMSKEDKKKLDGLNNYSLPAAGSALGGVRQAPNIANLAGDAAAAAIVTALNSLFANLRASGVMASK